MRCMAGMARLGAPRVRSAWMVLWIGLCAGCGQVNVVNEGEDDAPAQNDSDEERGLDAADAEPDSGGVGTDGEEHTAEDSLHGDSDATVDAEDTGANVKPVDDNAPKDGQAVLVFDLSSPAGTPAAWRKLTLNVFQSASPGPGKVYVWWAVAGDGSLSRVAALPYEDIPYKSDFTVTVPPPDDLKAQPLEGMRGARVTWEDEVSAASATEPAGPTVWQGEWPTGVWVHLVHSLAAKAPGQPGYLQDGSAIANYVEAQRVVALQGFQAAKPLLARAAIERAANAILGKAAAADHDSDGKVDFDAPLPTGLQGEDSPFAHGRKHIGFAAAAWPSGGVPQGHSLEVGKILIDAEVEEYATSVQAALPKLIAFANGKQPDFKAVDMALQGMHKQLGQVLQAGVQVATLPVVPKSP